MHERLICLSCQKQKHKQQQSHSTVQRILIECLLHILFQTPDTALKFLPPGAHTDPCISFLMATPWNLFPTSLLTSFLNFGSASRATVSDFPKSSIAWKQQRKNDLPPDTTRKILQPERRCPVLETNLRPNTEAQGEETKWGTYSQAAKLLPSSRLRHEETVLLLF